MEILEQLRIVASDKRVGHQRGPVSGCHGSGCGRPKWVEERQHQEKGCLEIPHLISVFFQRGHDFHEGVRAGKWQSLLPGYCGNRICEHTPC